MSAIVTVVLKLFPFQLSIAGVGLGGFSGSYNEVFVADGGCLCGLSSHLLL